MKQMNLKKLMKITDSKSTKYSRKIQDYSYSRAQRYNKRNNEIFASYEKYLRKEMEWLRRQGVSEDEIQNAYKNTGLHGSGLAKLIQQVAVENGDNRELSEILGEAHSIADSRKVKDSEEKKTFEEWYNMISSKIERSIKGTSYLPHFAWNTTVEHKGKDWVKSQLMSKEEFIDYLTTETGMPYSWRKAIKMWFKQIGDSSKIKDSTEDEWKQAADNAIKECMDRTLSMMEDNSMYPDEDNIELCLYANGDDDASVSIPYDIPDLEMSGEFYFYAYCLTKKIEDLQIDVKCYDEYHQDMYNYLSATQGAPMGYVKDHTLEGVLKKVEETIDYYGEEAYKEYSGENAIKEKYGEIGNFNGSEDNYDEMENLAQEINNLADAADQETINGNLNSGAMFETPSGAGEVADLLDEVLIAWDSVEIGSEQKKGHYDIKTRIIYEYGWEDNKMTFPNRYGLLLKTRETQYGSNVLECEVVDIAKYIEDDVEQNRKF